ncbi:hypothetical protein Efla_004899 [Eimeria flavescens]
MEDKSLFVDSLPHLNQYKADVIFLRPGPAFLVRMPPSLPMHQHVEAGGPPLDPLFEDSHDGEAIHDDGPTVSPVAEGKHAGTAEFPEGQRRHRNAPITGKWLFVVSAVGLFLMLVGCRSALSGSLVGGLQRRRLAGSGGNHDENQGGRVSPDFLGLCLQLSDWFPAESTAGGPRASPTMVQSFFESLEDHRFAAVEGSSADEQQETEGWASSTLPAKGHLASSFSEESLFEIIGEQQSSASEESEALELLMADEWNLPPSPADEDLEVTSQELFKSGDWKQTTARAGDSPVEPVGGEPASRLQSGSKRRANEDVADAGQPGPPLKVQITTKTPPSITTKTPPSTSKVIGLSSSEGPSSFTIIKEDGATAVTSGVQSTAGVGTAAPILSRGAGRNRCGAAAANGQRPSSQERSGKLEEHPFVRVPPLDSGVKARPFSASAMVKPLYDRCQVNRMLRLRELLHKKSLSQEDVDELVARSELLASFGIYNMATPLLKKRPHLVKESTGRRFLLFYMLQRAAKAVRQDWQNEPWWRTLADIIPSAVPEGMNDDKIAPLGQASWDTIKRLVAAIELYKQGGEPCKEETIYLMRQLFCLPLAPGRFKDEAWDPWRVDDAEHGERCS